RYKPRRAKNCLVPKRHLLERVLRRHSAWRCRRPQLQISVVSALHTQDTSSERHRRLIRTGLSASIAHLIRKGTRRRATDFIGVETVVPGANDQYAVAVNVDPIRSRAAPGQVCCPLPAYQAPLRSQSDLARRGCRRSRGSNGRGGSWRGCWSWGCGRELEFADARKPTSATG